MLLYLAALVLILCIINILFNYNHKARLIRKIPGPKDAFIIGNAWEVIVTPVEVMKLGIAYSNRWKGIFRFWSFPFGGVFIYNPEDVEIIISNVKYNDKSIIYKFLKPWLRNGLLVSNGEQWHQRRKLLTPAFHFNILRQFFVVLQENSQRMVENLQKYSGDSVDIVPVLSEFTLHSICETAMGTKLSEETTGAGRSYKEAVYDLGKVLVQRFIRVYLYPDVVFNMSEVGKTMHKYLSTVHRFTEKVILDRREYVKKYGIKLNEEIEETDDVVYKKKRKTAMLDLLLFAEMDGLIDTDGIQEEVDTFMFEGHDTTASGLTFCLLELANKKGIQDKIYSELQEIFGDTTRAATMDDLSKMKYMDCCIKESLRLYPPVHFISRNINEVVQLSGYTVPAGTLCHVNIMGLHRNPDLYKDPLVFDPDRFLPQNSVGRHPYAYIPFSAGPRNCIGQKFAIMEMKLAISEILRKFVLLPVTRSEDIQFTADLVLRNDGPVYVTFALR